MTCHLGGSCSLCAIENGKSVDTSFGMSLQTGVPQSNRVGDLDPYVIRYLEGHGLKEDDIFEAMTKKSGLLGISGVGKDLRDIMAAAENGNDRAALAVDMFTESVLRLAGGYAAEMGGLDNLVFTGGIGENSAYVREQVCKKLSFIGLELDEEANRGGNGAAPESCVSVPEVRVISKPGSRVRVLVIQANEEIVVGRSTYRYLTGQNN